MTKRAANVHNAHVRRKRSASSERVSAWREHREDRVSGMVLPRVAETLPHGGPLIGYERAWLDLGTGDGRFVRWLAAQHPTDLVIGLDACFANLREASRRAPANLCFLVADALEPPPEIEAALLSLAPQIERVTVNFPWGSLLRGLLPEDGRLLSRLTALTTPGTRLELRLNGGALTEIGWRLEDAGRAICRGLREAGFAMRAPVALGAAELRACQTTWAKRLAFGRDPRALYLRGERA